MGRGKDFARRFVRSSKRKKLREDANNDLKSAICTKHRRRAYAWWWHLKSYRVDIKTSMPSARSRFALLKEESKHICRVTWLVFAEPWTTLNLANMHLFPNNDTTLLPHAQSSSISGDEFASRDSEFWSIDIPPFPRWF